MASPALGHGLGFTDLYDREGLVRLDAAFVDWLKESHVEAHARLMAARANPDAVGGQGRVQPADRGGPSARGLFSGAVRRCCGGRRAARPPQHVGAPLRLQAPVRAALCDPHHQGGRRGGAGRRQGHGRGRPAGAARGWAGGLGARPSLLPSASAPARNSRSRRRRPRSRR